MSKKKKVIIWSDFCGAKTGFGKNARNLCEHLYKTGKYEVLNYACGMPWESADFERFPWKTIGVMPDQREFDLILNSTRPEEKEQKGRWVAYGNHYIDRLVKQEKPDALICINDPWGFDVVNKKWWDKFPCAIHTTIDSRPLLDQAQELAKKSKDYWVWSEFAEKEHHEHGQRHVKTVHGSMKTENFKRLSDSDRQHLRFKHGIANDEFIIGFVFRNQLRKQVTNLMEAFKIFKKDNPQIKKPKLLLHTHFGEGWDIMKHAKEIGVEETDIYCTYICVSCGEYSVRNFKGMFLDCPHCRVRGNPPSEHSQRGSGLITANTQVGVTESQLNEVYNLMNVYCHPFTSGGMEIPIFEAKLTELVTLVTNYSCGEDSCSEDLGSYPLEFSYYREFGSGFQKATTSPYSIAKQLKKVALMKPDKVRDMGKRGREWVIKNYDAAVVGKQIEDWIDSSPENNFDYELKPDFKNPEAPINKDQNPIDLINQCYADILDMHLPPDDQGVQHWMNHLRKGGKSADEMIEYFRHVARTENAKHQPPIDFEKILDNTGKKRIILIQPVSLGDIFIITSLFADIRKRFPREEYMFYVSTQQAYRSLVESCPEVDKWIEYSPQFDNSVFLQGGGQHKGYFEISYHPYFNTQRTSNYTQNGISNFGFDIKEHAPLPPELATDGTKGVGAQIL